MDTILLECVDAPHLIWSFAVQTKIKSKALTEPSSLDRVDLLVCFLVRSPAC